LRFYRGVRGGAAHCAGQRVSTLLEIQHDYLRDVVHQRQGEGAVSTLLEIQPVAQLGGRPQRPQQRFNPS